MAWLREILEKPSDVTVIVSGIQIFTDRVFFVEEFDWLNKKRFIIDLIRDTSSIKKSGYIFLSGDVHYA